MNPAPIVAPEMRVSPEQAWAEMAIYIKAAKGLCLCFLFSDQYAAFGQVQQALEDAWQARSTPLTKYIAEQASKGAPELAQADGVADVSHSVLQALHDNSLTGAPFWLEMLALDPFSSNEVFWDNVRATVIARLNESRTWLSQDFARPLIICLPADWFHRVPQIAPDLWQVRSFTAVLGMPTGALLLPIVLENTALDRTSKQKIEALRERLTNAERACAQAEAMGAAGEAEMQLALREQMLVAGELAEACVRKLQINTALVYGRHALDIAQKMREKWGETPEVLADVSVCLRQLGEAQVAAGRLDIAANLYQEALAMWEKILLIHPTEARYLIGLAEQYRKIGDMENFKMNGQEALHGYQNSLALYRQLRLRFGDSELRLSKEFRALLSLGGAEIRLGRVESALQMFKEAEIFLLKLQNMQCKEFDSQDGLLSLMGGYGFAQILAGKVEDARQSIESGLKLAEQLIIEQGEAPELFMRIAGLWLGLGIVAVTAQKNITAEKHFTQALEYGLKLRDISGSAAEMIAFLFTLYAILAINLTEQKKYRQAKEVKQTALALLNQLQATVGDLPYIKEFATQLAQLPDQDPSELPI